MKRYLKHDRYELDDHEAEGLWYAVRRELKGAGAPARAPGRNWRPALASASVALVAVLAAGWWLGGRGPGDVPDPVAATATPGRAATRTEAPVVARVQPDPGRTPARTATPHGADATTVVPAAGLAAREPAAADRDSQAPVVAMAQEMIVVAEPGTDVVARAAGSQEVVSETFQDYAIESVESALREKAAAVDRAGETEAAGGRPAESRAAAGSPANRPASRPGTRFSDPGQARMAMDVEDVLSRPRAAAPAPARGSITGGTTAPNGERFESMYFEHPGTNPFVATEEDRLSTFALDVDNASFTLARSYLARGQLPPPAAIRVEEFVNAIDAGWPPHGGESFRIGMDGGPSRFGEGYHLLRLGIVAGTVDATERKPADLVFVIDISGSMARENRLGAVQHALRVLVDELGEGDRVGIVTYGTDAEVRLPLVDASRREEILAVINGLHTTGATNAAAGLRLGYEMARRDFERGRVSRVLLCSDGVANAGPATDVEGILGLARRGADDGVELSTIGFGMGNYNDVLMEGLADQGDGNYFYVDGPREAERVFRENLAGMLQTVAREAKVQVEFDPGRVVRWRLLGYENRDVADRDFRNDSVDAGEVGAGHQVTALYELKLADDVDAGDDSRLGTVRLRWEAPLHDTARAGRVTEIERPIRASMLAARDRDGTPQRRAQALAAEFAEILRHSYWAKESSPSDLLPLAYELARELPGDRAVRDLANMIWNADMLWNHSNRGGGRK